MGGGFSRFGRLGDGFSSWVLVVVGFLGLASFGDGFLWTPGIPVTAFGLKGEVV